MLKHRTLALLLASSIMLALGTTIVAADPGETLLIAPAPQTTQGAHPTEGDFPVEAPEVLPDEVGTLSFANLESRMRENNFNMRALQEAINAMEVLDYEEMSDELRETLNNIADQQWGMMTNPMMPGIGSMMAQSMQSSYDSVKEVFDSIKEGEMQADNAAMVRQWRNAQDQLIMAGESIYAGLLSLDYTKGSLERQLAALDRQIQVAELSYEQGNLSALALQEAKAGRASLVSGIETVKMNEATLKMQLESFVGEDLTGKLLLQTVPQVSAEQISAMDLEKDFAAAKEASYELFAAKRTLDDAKETFEETAEDYSSNSTDYNYLSAKHQWQAAQYTYEGTCQGFELKFRTLYLQVKDYYQVWQAAKAALEAEEAGYAADELKYSQGRISQNAMSDAMDALTTAREKVATSGLELFTAYNNYCWAVDHGILN